MLSDRKKSKREVCLRRAGWRPGWVCLSGPGPMPKPPALPDPLQRALRLAQGLHDRPLARVQPDRRLQPRGAGVRVGGGRAALQCRRGGGGDCRVRLSVANPRGGQSREEGWPLVGPRPAAAQPNPCFGWAAAPTSHEPSSRDFPPADSHQFINSFV